MSKSQKKNESGRSMVEILGVLAVMGVLSVAGIAGYNSAMNRHRANELLNEASKRAVVVAGQVTMGGRTPSLSEFTNPTGYTFDVKGPDGTKAWASGDNQFSITVNGVSEAVCNHMQNMKTALIQKFEPSDCATTATVKLTYNADLSVGNSSGSSGGQEEITPTCDPECTGGKECVAENTCACPSDKPFWNGSECEASKQSECGNDYYIPELNMCISESSCRDLSVDAIAIMDSENHICQMNCQSDEFVLKSSSGWPECCPNDKVNLMGWCMDACPANTEPFCAFSGGNGGQLNPDGTCVDGIGCCDKDVITYEDRGYYYQACCPAGSETVVMGQCVSGTCNGTWYCDGELYQSGECIDSVGCCNETVLHLRYGDRGGFQVCCPSDHPVWDLDAGCTPCTGGQQGYSTYSSDTYPICQCATGYHFDYDDAMDCVPD